jgi:hypothetical protein
MRKRKERAELAYPAIEECFGEDRLKPDPCG